MELSELVTWNEIKKEWTVVCNMLAFLIIRMAMSDHVILGGGPPFIFYCLSGNINVVHYVMVGTLVFTKCLLYYPIPDTVVLSIILHFWKVLTVLLHIAILHTLDIIFDKFQIF